MNESGNCWYELVTPGSEGQSGGHKLGTSGRLVLFIQEEFFVAFRAVALPCYISEETASSFAQEIGLRDVKFRPTRSPAGTPRSTSFRVHILPVRNIKLSIDVLATFSF